MGARMMGMSGSVRARGDPRRRGVMGSFMRRRFPPGLIRECEEV